MPAIGQASPLSPHGALRFDVRNYRRPSDGADSYAAIQRAHDAAHAASMALFNGGNAPTSTVFLPAGDYRVSQPICVDSFVCFKGEGPNTRVLSAQDHGSPAFAVGLSRSSTPPGATYRPDLFGKLDTSTVPASGQKWGLRFNTMTVNGQPAHAWYTSQGSMFSHGGGSTLYNGNADRYAETTRLLIDFACEGPAGGQMPAGAYLMGVGDNANTNRAGLTWQVQTGSANQFILNIGTQSARFATTIHNSYAVSTGSATGVQRVAFQVDLTTGAVTAYTGTTPTQAAVTPSGPGLAGQVTISENEYNYFLINGVQWQTSGSADWSLYGLKIGRGLFFTAPGVGAAAAAIDGNPVNDRRRYFPQAGDDPQAIGFMRFTEDPANSPRWLEQQNGGQAQGTYSGGFLVMPDQFGPSSSSNRFEDLTVGTGNAYGAAMGLYFVLDQKFSRVGFSGGAYGLANALAISNYPVSIDGCSFFAWDSCHLGVFSTVSARDTTLSRSGLVAWREIGSNLSVDSVMQTGAGNPQYAYMMSHPWSGGGGAFAQKNVLLDNEDSFYLYAGISIESVSGSANVVQLDNVNLGVVGEPPMILLKTPPGTGVGRIAARNVVGGSVGAVIDADAGWIGSVEGSITGGPDVANSGATPGRVVVENFAGFPTPPHFGAWYRGQHQIPVPSAADGQFSRIEVDRTGTIGSATPPLFFGSGARATTANASLAAYATDHTAISATVSGHASSFGTLTNNGMGQLAAALFRQAAITPPASFKFALSVIGANAAGSIQEPTAGGYSSRTIANNSSLFGSASAGVKANAASISFGTATASYQFKSLAIVDPVTGWAWATIQFPAPVTVAVGDTPTIAIGGLTFTHTPLPGSQFGCLTDFGWGKVWDFGFGATATTFPATWFVGTSTVAGSKTTTTLTEPTNGYARVSVANGTANFQALQNLSFQSPTLTYGDAVNLGAIAFPAATGTQATSITAALTDASSAGNVWAVAPLTVPVTPTAGVAPTFAAGAFSTTVN